MGQHGPGNEAQKRRKAFEDYKIDSQIMESAPPHAVVLHCLPAHRGEEITEEGAGEAARAGFRSG